MAPLTTLLAALIRGPTAFYLCSRKSTIFHLYRTAWWWSASPNFVGG
ncbi:MAG TPA: hypothetical protein [Caudoviricetes sp.]|nr:MAG TPA: hypothetical protein [Caudoviricetes sp.]